LKYNLRNIKSSKTIIHNDSLYSIPLSASASSDFMALYKWLYLLTYLLTYLLNCPTEVSNNVIFWHENEIELVTQNCMHLLQETCFLLYGMPIMGIIGFRDNI